MSGPPAHPHRYRDLAEFQGGEGEQRENEGKDPETDYDLGLAPAELLEVMMERRHLEDAFFAELVAADLEDDGDRFKDEDAADEGEQQFLADDDSDSADGAAKGQRADVAHEDFSRVGVVPEKADGRANHGSAEDGEFANHGHALEFKVVGEDNVAADVGEYSERTSGDDGAADGEAVEAVGEVDGVGGTHEHEDDEGHEGQEGKKAEMRNGREPVPLQVGAKGLDEGHR